MPISTIGSAGLTASGVTSVSLDSNAQYTGFKNRIINGAMVIDQRNAGAATANTISGYTVDRWQVVQSPTTGKVIGQQNAGAVTPPAGFNNYYGITSQSAFSIVAGSIYTFIQPIEGFNFADMAWGTANAQTITLSFWVRSSLTGTFGGSLGNGSSFNRSYPFTYTISSANTWEQKTITIAGDTTGTWAGATNGIGVYITFGLGVGSTYSSTAGAWATGDFRSATGATSVVGTNGATWYVTGVQLEKGSTATSFDYRPYGTELQLCQRYYYPVRGSGQFADVVATTTTDAFFAATFPVEMRASPTMTGVLSGLIVNNFTTAYTASGGSWSFNSTGTQGVSVRRGGFTSLSTTVKPYFVGTTSIVVTADAEL